MIDQTAVDAQLGQMAQLDAVEVLDPADAAAHHAQQPLRLLPLPAGPVGAAEDADAGGEAVRGTDGLVEFHQSPGDGRQPSVLTLHLVQTAPEFAGQDVDAVAHADDGLFGGGGAVELRLDAHQRGPQDLAQFGLEVGADLGALLDGRQDVVDGVAGAQSAHRVRQLLVGEPGHGGHLVVEPLLPGAGLLGEARLVGGGLLGQPLVGGPGLFGQARLVRPRLLGQPGVQGRPFGGELPLEAGHVLLPLLGVLGLRRAVRVLGPAQLRAGAQEEAYAHGAGRRRRHAGDGDGYSLRAHERRGYRPASQAQRHQPPAVPGDRARAAGGGVASSICILRTKRSNTGGAQGGPHS